MAKGIVKSFNEHKGFGFIAVTGSPDVFVFITSVKPKGTLTLNPGDRVTFDIKEGSKGKTAENVVVEKQ
jgi:CspA family cold shock protein